MNLRFLKLFIYISLGVIPSSFGIKSAALIDAVCSALSKIPTEEKYFLDCFFRILLLKNSGIFVLNGSKPVACAAYMGPDYYQTTIHWKGFYTSTLFKRGFAVWQKYQHLFPSKKYCIFYEENKEDDIFEVFILNKERFTEAVYRNNFKNILAEDTPEMFLKKVIDRNISFRELLRQNVFFEGVILGYGRHNAWLFHQRDLLEQGPIPKKLDPKAWLELDKRLLSFSDEKSPLLFVFLPRFACDVEHFETKDLRKSYGQQRKECTALYREGNFLSTALKTFVSS